MLHFENLADNPSKLKEQVGPNRPHSGQFLSQFQAAFERSQVMADEQRLPRKRAGGVAVRQNRQGSKSWVARRYCQSMGAPSHNCHIPSKAKAPVWIVCLLVILLIPDVMAQLAREVAGSIPIGTTRVPIGIAHKFNCSLAGAPQSVNDN